VRAALCLALVLLGLLVAQPAHASAPVLPPCDWDRELLTALAVLGEHPSDWTVTLDTDGPGAAWTNLEARTVTIRRDQPCRLIASMVNHEHMHLQQSRLYGVTEVRALYTADPLRMEFLADCGSMLLGSTYTPYLAGHHHECTAVELAEVRRLISYLP
jgi:hypothetical protein